MSLKYKIPNKIKMPVAVISSNLFPSLAKPAEIHSQFFYLKHGIYIFLLGPLLGEVKIRLILFKII
jgi:hypothetical protein